MTRIDRLWPDPLDEVSDEELVARPEGPWLRVNFISSVDGAATVGGVSGGLGNDADKRSFELLRRVSDAVLVGAGTVRSEGYTALRVSDESVAWRVEHGMPPHPVFVIVSGRLDLDPASPIFTDAPVTPIIVTKAGRDASAFDGLADVIVAGEESIDLRVALDALRDRKLDVVLNEGGPSLFGSLLAAGLVDELRLTVSPLVVAGDSPRITSGPLATPAHARLDQVFTADGALLLSYLL
ncbi:MAG: pyrimidine reductase family protein [Microbacteriaceae bacterium]|nr:pyrimidine reductase family protein [Microbacteriaceae bacterium]